MMQLSFSGWFQCRLATDPDPTDEPRGISGWTYALPGEPNLDRIIRTQPEGATIRTPGPTIGVNVEAVSVDRRIAEEHVLKGARVVLQSNPVFEGRNGIASEDADEPIFPFHILVEAGAVRLDREFRDLDTSDWRFELAKGTERNSAAMAKAGIVDLETHLAARATALRQRLDETDDPLERLRLQVRQRHLTERGFGTVPLFVGLRYRYILDGPWAKVTDPDNALKGTIDSSPWIFNAWAGCWDSDALCGFMTGDLQLPFRAAQSQ